ncbi:hypothetical protein FACS189419_09170 [Planctomycetales bacterium]|nr:hypothetical protein FACS189419_09170 [Planctomycetales bacterium]
MEIKPLQYTIWLTFDQKRSVVFLGLFVAALGCIILQSGGQILLAVCLLLLLLTVWHIFLPVKFEINAQGIIRTVLGRRWFIAWRDIKGYQIRYNGLLLLPQNKRYFVESFNGFFLPVPAGLMPEILYRFKLFVGG